MAGGALWTKREDAAVRKWYPKRSKRARAKLLRLLPRRKWEHIQQRAAELRVLRVQRWTPEEEAIIAAEWHDSGARALKSKLPGRSWSAIYGHAVTRLGLPTGIPQGCESIAESVRRCGISWKMMQRICMEFGAKIHRLPSKWSLSGRTQTGWMYVQIDEVNAAVASWNETECVNQAAKSRGLADDTLRRWLIADEVIDPPDGSKRHVRVRSDIIDRVVRETPQRVMRWAVSLRARRPVRPGYRPLSQWRGVAAEVRRAA